MSIRVVAAGSALAVAAIAGYVAWDAHAKREERRAITGLVRDAASGLATSLEEPSPERAQELDALAQALQRLDVRRHKPYAEAADVYLVSARAIAQRQADAARLAAGAREARDAFLAHLRGSRGRSDAWIRQAAELSRRVDQSYAEYVRVQEALVELLRTLPEAEKPLLPYAGSLADPALHEAALRQAQAGLHKAVGEAESARRLRAP